MKWPLERRYSLIQWLLACAGLAILLLAARSIWYVDAFGINTSPFISGGFERSFVISVRAKPHVALPPRSILVWSTYGAGGPWYEWLVPEVDVTRFPDYQVTAAIPYWIPIAGIAIALWAVGKKKSSAKSRRQLLCPKCGYDLRATPYRCPECGTVQAEQSRQRGRNP